MKTFRSLTIVFVFTLIFTAGIASAQTDAKIFVNNLECLELENASMANTTRVKVAPCSSSALQNFKIAPVGTSGNSVNIKISSSRCIEILGANTNNGVAVTQWNCDSSPEQTFQLAGNIANLSASRSINGPIRFSHSGKCFDTSQRPIVKQFPCNGSRTQVFEIASVPRTSILVPTFDKSDRSWKWSNSNPVGWNTVGFNDSGWFQAIEQTNYGGSPWNRTATFPPGTTAKWIWAANTATAASPEPAGSVRFFRKTFIPNTNSAEMTITVDNSFTAFLNGVPIGGGTNWTNPQTIKLSLNAGTTNVIAVRAVNDSGPAGLLAHVSFAPPTPNTPSRAEQSFWNLVKNSNDASDFQSYLNTFPTGAFAPIARLRIKQINRSKGTIPNPPNPTSTVSRILNNDVAVITKKLPQTVGQVNLTDISSFCRTGCTNFATSDFLTLEGWTPRLSGSQRDAQAQAIKPALLIDYCNSGAFQGGMNLNVKIFDRNKGSSFANDFSYFITPSDCPGNPKPQPPTTGKDSPDDEFWNKIKNSTRVGDYEVYIQAFPNGKHKADALLMIDRLKRLGNDKNFNNGNNTQDDDDRFWDKIKGSNRASDFDLYLKEFPNGKYRVDAILLKDRLGEDPQVKPKPDPKPETSPDDDFWNKIKNSTRVEDFEVYLQAFPNGKYKADALLNISRLKPKPKPKPDPKPADDEKEKLTRCTVATKGGGLNVRNYDGQRIGRLSKGEIVYLNEEEGSRAKVSQRRNGRFVVIGWVAINYLDCEF